MLLVGHIDGINGRSDVGKGSRCGQEGTAAENDSKLARKGDNVVEKTDCVGIVSD